MKSFIVPQKRFPVDEFTGLHNVLYYYMKNTMAQYLPITLTQSGAVYRTHVYFWPPFEFVAETGAKWATFFLFGRNFLTATRNRKFLHSEILRYLYFLV